MRKLAAVVIVFAVVVAVRAPCPSSRDPEAMGTRGWRLGASGEAVPRGSEEDWEEEDDEDDWGEDEEDDDQLLEDPMGEATRNYWQAKREGLL